MEDNQNIVEKLERQFEESSLQVRAKDSRENFANLNRDAGFFRVHIMANAAINTQLMFSDPSDLEVLDTIVLMLEHIVSGALQKQEEIGHFRDLYAYLEQGGEQAWKVYAMWVSSRSASTRTRR